MSAADATASRAARVRAPAWLARFLRSAGGRATGPVVMALAAAIPVVEARLATVIVGGVLVALSHVSVQHQLEDLERANADTLSDDICEILVHNIGLLEHLKRTEGGLFRASVLLVDVKSTHLSMKMYSHGFRDDDRNVAWAKGEGPPGMAWQLGRPIIAPPPERLVPRARGAQHLELRSPVVGADDLPAEDGGEPSRAFAQRQFLQQVEMMVCYPITDVTHPNRVLGVLTLDDRLPPGPHLEDVLGAVEFLCEQLRRRLTMTQTARPFTGR